ncbi:MAG TPA: GDSL-type esterase/lipase family protein [Thermoanaerobaculia bacterium]
MRRFLALSVFAATTAGLTLLEIRSARVSQNSIWADDVIRVAVLGDSVAHGAGDESNHGIAGFLDRELASRGVHFAPTANLGINGARTRDVLRLLKTSYAQKLVRIADTVVVSIGGNDLYGDTLSRAMVLFCADCAMQAVLARTELVVHRIERINPSARIILLGLYDPYRQRSLDRLVNRWDSRLIMRFAEDSAVDVVRIADIFSSRDSLSPRDHFHPSTAGYALIAARIAPVL